MKEFFNLFSCTSCIQIVRMTKYVLINHSHDKYFILFNIDSSLFLILISEASTNI